MSLKYRRSILFDKPQQTTAKLQLQTLVHDYKEKLNFNSRANSLITQQQSQRLTIHQAKQIQSLQQKLKTISFHTLYKQYHRNSELQDQKPATLYNPQKLQMFRKGKFYRCHERPSLQQIRERGKTIQHDLKEYYHRCPQQEPDPFERKDTKVVELKRSKTSYPSRRL